MYFQSVSISHGESFTVFTKYPSIDASIELSYSPRTVALPLILVNDVWVEVTYTNFV